MFVNRENTLTVAYASELNGENLTAKVTTLFGEMPKSLDRVLRKDMNIESIRAPDNSAFNISGISYDKDAHKLRLAVKNTGEVAAYANAQVTLLIYGEENVLTQNKPMLIEPGASMDAVFITTLSDTNIEENPLVKVRLNYGERESALAKVLEGNYPLEIRSNLLIPVIAAALVAAAIIGVIIPRRKRKRSA